MAAITPVNPSIGGVQSDGTNASSSDSVPNPKGNVLLRVNNGSGASINVTIAAGANPTRPADGTFPAMTLANKVVAIATGHAMIIGPIPPAFNDANGNVQVSYSATTSVTVEAIQIPA